MDCGSYLSLSENVEGISMHGGKELYVTSICINDMHTRANPRIPMISYLLLCNR